MPRPVLRHLAFVVALTVPVLAPAARADGPAQPRELKRLRVLLVIDTESNLASSVQKDRNNMRDLLEKYIDEKRRTIDIIEGTKVTREDILRYYRDLKTGPDEALLFFYAGHGCTDPKLGHCLQPQMAKTPLIPRADIRRAMREKGAGLVVLLTDCCSTVVRTAPPPVGRPRVDAKPVLRCLFFQHRGTVDITAAEDGTGSYGDADHGGVFTGALVSLMQKDLEDLDQNGDGFLSWKEFFPRLTRETEDHFNDFAKRARAKGEYVRQKSQKPRSFNLPPEPPTGHPEEDAKKTYAVVSIRNDSGKVLSYRYRWSGEREWKVGKVAKKGTAFYQLAVADPSRLPTLEVVADSGPAKGHASLKPAKWTGNGRPSYRDGKEYRVGNRPPSRETALTAESEMSLALSRALDAME
jgi:hypothetical protein